MELHERISALRKESGMTMDYLGSLIGCSAQAIGNYERGVRKPKYKILEAMADVFNVDMDYLLCRTDVKRRITLAESKFDSELSDILSQLRTDPERRILFHTLKGCTKEEVLQAVKIIEVLKK